MTTELTLCEGGCGRLVRWSRCRLCNGVLEKQRVATELRDEDAELLRWRDVEKLTAERIAARKGVSRNRAYQLLQKARRREAIRAEYGLPLAAG